MGYTMLDKKHKQIIRDLVEYFAISKRWGLTPLVMTIFLLCYLFVSKKGYMPKPFIYTMF